MLSNLMQPAKRRPKELMAGMDLPGHQMIKLLYKYTNNVEGHVYTPLSMLKSPTTGITTWMQRDSNSSKP